MKISISSYSLRNEWKVLGKDKIDSLIAICKDMNIENVELLDSEFTPETLPTIVKKMANNGITVFAIAVGLGLLAKPEEVEATVKEGKRIIKMAHDSGIKYIRFFVGDGPMPRAFPPMEDFDENDWKGYKDQMDEAVNLTDPVLTSMLALAEQLGVYIGLESHHSYSSNYIYMEALLKRFPSPNIGWVFDIGNFDNDNMRWKALEIIKKRVFYLHAKAYAFDEKGFEKTLDYPKICQILADANFNGIWSIEFEGKMNGIFGIQKNAELIKYSIAKSQGKEYAMNLMIPTGEDLIKKYQFILKNHFDG